MSTSLIFLILVAALLLVVFGASIVFPHRTAAVTVAGLRRLAGMKTRSVEIPGFRIAYMEGGKGEPLVLIHGIGGDKDHWVYTGAFLRRHYRVIAFDVPGFGESSRPADASYRVEEQVERLRAFLRAIGVDHAHFGGNSMGGLIAANYAIRYPDEVDSLWLLNTAYIASATPSDAFEILERDGKIVLFAETTDQFKGVIDFVMAKPPFMPSSIKRVLAEQQVASYALNVQIFNELRATMVPLEQAAAGLATPTLIVWGELDRVFHYSSAEILQKVMPRSRVIVMKGLGHLPMVEAPYPTARDYHAFRRTL